MQSRSSIPGPRETQGAAVLIVEESAADARQFQEALEKAAPDLRCTRVGTAVQFERALCKTGWDVAICGGNLPTLPLVEIVARIRSAPVDVPVIVSTHSRWADVVEGAVLAGAADYVPKSALVRLAQVVARELESRALQRRVEQLEQRLREQVLQALRLQGVGQKALSVAHDVATPLQCVVGGIDCLSNNLADVTAALEDVRDVARNAMANPTAEALTEIDRAATEALDLVDADDVNSAIEDSTQAVEMISRIVEGVRLSTRQQLTVPRTRIELKSLLEKVVRLSRHQWEDVATLRADFDSSAVELSVREDDLARALSSLVVNAAHAIASRPEGAEPGVIRIQTVLQEDYVQISVGDNGTGIPPSVRERMFEPFFTTKPAGKGTGQGLSFAYSTVTSGGGAIEVDTEVGEGTVFHVYLPIGALANAVAGKSWSSVRKLRRSSIPPDRGKAPTARSA